MQLSPNITFLSPDLGRHQILLKHLKSWVTRIQIGSELHLEGEADLILIEADFPFSKIYKFLKNLQHCQSTACIILMGPALNTSRVSAFLQAGVFDYLKIPFSPRRLRKAIHKGLRNRENLIKILELSDQLEIANKALSGERDQLKRMNHDLSQIYALNQSLSESLHINEVVRAFMLHVKKMMTCDIVALYLQSWNQVHLEADRSRWGGLIDQISEDTRQEGVSFSRLSGPSLRAIARSEGREIMIPLEVGKNKVGLLRLLHIPLDLARSPEDPFPQNNREKRRDFQVDNRFAPHQLKLLSMIAAPLAIAIRNAEVYRQVEDLAVKDALTGVLNRRAFSSILEREFTRADRYDTPLSLMVIDLDHFKRVNDTYGHLVGDQVLQEMAAIFKESLRDIDVLIRYGGEEFVVILPGTSIRKGLVVANRIKERVEKAIFHETAPIKMTVSIGLAETPADEIKVPEDLFQQADQALYTAKRKGRNLIVTAQDIEAAWHPLALVGQGLGEKRRRIRKLAST